MRTHDKRLRYAHNLLILLTISLIVVRAPMAGAQDMDSTPPPETPGASCQQIAPEPSDEESGEPAWKGYGKMADALHRMISAKLVSSANWLDSFFREERSEIEENNTSLRLRLSSFLEEGQGMTGDARIRLRLVLPELQDKLHIIISGERDEDPDLRNDPMSKTAEIDDEAERNVNLSLRYFIRAARDRNFSFKIGTRVNKFSPVLYAGPRFRVSKQFDPWLARFTQEIKWFSDDGWESSTRFDFEKSLAERIFFRTSTGGYWFQEEIGYYYDVNFVLYQVVDGDRAVEYGWSNYFETRPQHKLDQLLLSVKYRQRFWRKWLFFEIKPQLAFRQEDDYELTPGITFAVEAFFGNQQW